MSRINYKLRLEIVKRACDTGEVGTRAIIQLAEDSDLIKHEKFCLEVADRIMQSQQLTEMVNLDLKEFNDRLEIYKKINQPILFRKSTK